MVIGVRDYSPFPGGDPDGHRGEGFLRSYIIINI